MAIGTITLQEGGGGQTLQPIFFDHIRFLGDETYGAGGTEDFASLVAAALGKTGVNIIGVVKAGPCGGYEVFYNNEDDKLVLYVYPDAAGVATENSTVDLSGVTMDLVVLYT